MAAEKFEFIFSGGAILQVEVSKDDRGTWRWARRDPVGTTTHAGLRSVSDALRDARASATHAYKEGVVKIVSNVEWERTSENQYKATIYGHAVTVDLSWPECQVTVLSEAKGPFKGSCSGWDWKSMAEWMARVLDEEETREQTTL